MKPRLVAICLFISIVGLETPASGQISVGGTPHSFSKLALSDDIPEITMFPVNVPALLAEDERDQREGVPFRFGVPFDVAFSTENSGRWDDLPDGGRIWRLKISSPGAYSINLIYSRFHLPDGAMLFVYSADRRMVLGAFTSGNNKEHGRFSTAPVRGDVCIVEYYEPANIAFAGEIEISRVVHAYKDIFGFGDAGACNVNVNCPEGEGWQEEKRAVALIISSGGYSICTGALINNVRRDETPYFLTANHCLGTEETWIFMFNYESPGCENVDGPTSYTISGSTLLAHSSVSDFALVQLSTAPPLSYNPYYAGWTNSELPSAASVTIHHPQGDIKKISFDYQPLTSADYMQPTGTSHWMVGNWEIGTTEAGSSGGPLFNPDHRIVGQLHGGYASCTDTSADWFGKFSLSWSGGGSPSNSLQDWLDPDHTGATAIDGFDPDAPLAIAHIPLSDTPDTVNGYEVVCFIYSTAPLVPDELWLHYEDGGQWWQNALESIGTDLYRAYIPARKAGDTVNYFLSAADVDGHTDTTGIFTFTIEYSPSIAVNKDNMTHNLRRDESIADEFIVENTGNGELTYQISISEQSPGLSPAMTLSGGGPDEFGYTWLDSDDPGGPVFNWIDISGSGLPVVGQLADDNYIGPFDIGFDFSFYGMIYNRFYIGSNGLIGFDSVGMQAFENQHIPVPDPPDNFLAWLWDDLSVHDADNPGAGVYIETIGDSCIIQFDDYPEFGANPGEVVTAQVILSVDGTITFQYESVASGFDVFNCTIGIENVDGTGGLETIYLASYLKSGLAVQYYPPDRWLTLSRYSGSLPPGVSDTISAVFDATGLDSGQYIADIVISSNDLDPLHNPWQITAEMNVLNGVVCGDVSVDGQVDMGDIVYLINHIFKSGPPPDPISSGDANGDGRINVGDAIYLIVYVFNGGSAPICP